MHFPLHTQRRQNTQCIHRHTECSMLHSFILFIIVAQNPFKIWQRFAFHIFAVCTQIMNSTPLWQFKMFEMKPNDDFNFAFWEFTCSDTHARTCPHAISVDVFLSLKNKYCDSDCHYIDMLLCLLNARIITNIFVVEFFACIDWASVSATFRLLIDEKPFCHVNFMQKLFWF